MTEETMKTLASDTTSTNDSTSFADLFESTDTGRVVTVGDVATGTVVGIEGEMVVIDVGDKCESYVAMDEFRREDRNIDLKIGDTVEVYVERRKDEGGLQLSRERAIAIKVWDRIASIQEDDGVISGKIDSRVKGGMSVDIGVPAFLPYSQIDLRPVKDLDALIGQSFDFKVLKFNRKRNNVVISRRVLLESERSKKRNELVSSLAEDQILTGTITNITDYGLFIDLGGIDGLCHITDISWGRVSHPSRLFRSGQEIEVKILKYDRDTDRVSLGIKQLRPDPWESVASRYPVGEKAAGKVVSITDYGAFVELEEGVEGLIHISEMTWAKKPRHPSKFVAIGDGVEVVILNIDKENKRISLGMKQLQPNPWDLVSDNYPVGSIIEGKIKNITDFGIFIGIEDGIDGLIHVSDLSWTERIKHPGDKFAKGDTIQAVVLKIDKENERFSLGIKQLEPDPWMVAAERFGAGARVSGTITNVTDFGIFVELTKGIEGLIHISEIEDSDEPVAERYKTGDCLDVMIINFSPEEKKIGLSIKSLNRDEKETAAEAAKRQAAGPSTLGDLIKKAAQDQNAETTKDENN